MTGAGARISFSIFHAPGQCQTRGTLANEVLVARLVPEVRQRPRPHGNAPRVPAPPRPTVVSLPLRTAGVPPALELNGRRDACGPGEKAALPRTAGVPPASLTRS